MTTHKNNKKNKKEQYLIWLHIKTIKKTNKKRVNSKSIYDYNMLDKHFRLGSIATSSLTRYFSSSTLAMLISNKIDINYFISK